MKDRLNAALDGDLEAFMAEELDLAERAVTSAVHGRASRLKTALRADVISGGLGRRLSRSWQQKNYPKHGTSLGAAAYVYTKAETLIEAFDAGATIKSSEGFFLAIPTPSAPKRGMGRKRITPSNFPEHRFGPLRFVYRPRGASLLVVDNQRKTKAGNYTRSRSKKALHTGEGLHTVPMFFLVPQARLRRRLNVDAVTNSVYADLAGDIDAAFRATRRRRLR